MEELEKKIKELEKRQTEIMKFYDNIVRNVLDQVEANTEKFYDTVKEMQISYFETLEKQSSRLLGFFEDKKRYIEPPLDETPKKLDDLSINDISREELRDDPLSEENRVPIVPGLKVQFEGEEIVHPVNIE